MSQHLFPQSYANHSRPTCEWVLVHIYHVHTHTHTHTHTQCPDTCPRRPMRMGHVTHANESWCIHILYIYRHRHTQNVETYPVWHGSFTRVTWLIRVRRMTHLHINESSMTHTCSKQPPNVITLLHVTQVSFAKKPYTRDHILQKRPIIWRSLLIVTTWLIHARTSPQMSSHSSP